MLNPEFNDSQLFINNRWREMAGLPPVKKEIVNLNELRVSEWSEEFEELMRNRLVMGALRYGKIHAPNKPVYDRVGSIIKRIHKYHLTGNKEFLIDVANLCLLEFEECRHPNAHLNASDDGDHVTIKHL